jgi:hypothetical protein
MSALVYTLHCIVVFGVPTLFGWVFLRRGFREANWMTLCPGAVVTGMAALMAIANELRFFFEMRLALWTTYKILLLLTLLMAVLPSRPPWPRFPRSVKAPWKLFLISIGALCAAAYFGIPAQQGILNDAWWFHYPTSLQIQAVERFPLFHVFAPDTPLFYHYGPDIIAAAWSFLLEIPVQSAFAIYIIILAPCTFLLAFALIERLARNFWSAILGSTFLVVGGNLRFLLFVSGNYFNAVGAMRVFNSQIIQGMLQMMFTPSHTFGLPLVLIAVLLYRRTSVSPSWRPAAAFGLLLGTFTLVSEWYFLPLVSGLILLMLRDAYRRRTGVGTVDIRRMAFAILPSAIALFWGTFNNTYIAGEFGHFWMGYENQDDIMQNRVNNAHVLAPPKLADNVRGNGAAKEELPVPPQVDFYKPVWEAPDLLPLRLNLTHFGQVPSWESAESDSGTFVPILSIQFFLEASPILLLGIPFGLWLAWYRRSPALLLLAWLTVASAIPPIFLDWGYRSTDFLRFFSASFSYAALFFGWLAGALIAQPYIARKAAGILCTVCCLINPVGLGILGLTPGNIEKVKKISSTASSLSTLQSDSGPEEERRHPGLAKESSNIDSIRQFAFVKLATQTGDFLYPIAKGRERAIVIVPPEQLPKLALFPEWMKMATYSRISLPVGWHWCDSIYSAYYRDAVLRLDPQALIALDAKWVIVSNIFLPTIPSEVIRALSDRLRFTATANFRDGDYYMTVFRVVQ